MYAASHSFWSLQTMSVYHINWHVILIELLKIPIPGVNSAVEISLYRVLNFIDKISEVKLGNSNEVGGEDGGVREKSRQRNRLLVSLRDQDQRGMPGYREFEKA